MYSSPNIMRVKTSRKMGIAGNVESMRERRVVYRARDEARWEVNITLDIQDVGWGDMD